MRHQVGDVTLIHGDCLDVMPTLAAGSVDMVFADLPYCVTRNHWDIPIDLGAFWCCVRSVRIEHAAIVMTSNFRFGTKLLAANEKEFRYDIVWSKTLPVGFLLARKQPLQAHEYVLLFRKKTGPYNPQKKMGGLARMRCPNKTASPTYGGFVRDKARSWDDGSRFPTTVLQVNENDTIHRKFAKFKRHPTQKPVALLEWLIKTYTNDGDTILDPVAGSGTTAIAAMRVGNRKVVCIEKDKTYYDAMVARVTAEHVKVAT